MSDPTIHILRTPGHYIGQVRGLGCRMWETVTNKCDTPESALTSAAACMKGYKRARVLWVGDGECYYDPHVVMEARRL